MKANSLAARAPFVLCSALHPIYVAVKSPNNEMILSHDLGYADLDPALANSCAAEPAAGELPDPGTQDGGRTWPGCILDPPQFLIGKAQRDFDNTAVWAFWRA